MGGQDKIMVKIPLFDHAHSLIVVLDFFDPFGWVFLGRLKFQPEECIIEIDYVLDLAGFEFRLELFKACPWTISASCDHTASIRTCCAFSASVQLSSSLLNLKSLRNACLCPFFEAYASILNAQASHLGGVILPVEVFSIRHLYTISLRVNIRHLPMFPRSN
jgi:hypothetical protein